MSYTVLHPAFLDCQAEATGSHSAGTTTWTFTTQRPYTMALYKPTGETITLSTADNLNFTASGDYSGGVAVLGVGYATTIILSQPILRGEDQLPETSGRFNIIYADFSFTDTIKVDITWSRRRDDDTEQDSGSQTFDDTVVGTFGIPHFARRRLFVMGDAEKTLIKVESPATYPYPMTVTGVQYQGNIVEFPR